MSEPKTTKRPSEKDIFFEVIERTTPEERAACLDLACGGDATLRKRIELLVAKHFESDNFMKEPAVEGVASTDSSSAAPEGLGSLIGRYKLRESIGEGGCGVVYVAEQEEPVRRLVALKVIKVGMDTRSVIARFDAERQALAMMDHPNIAKVLDAGATA